MEPIKYSPLTSLGSGHEVTKDLSIHGSQILEELDSRNDPTLDHIVYFFHPSLPVRPDSVSFTVPAPERADEEEVIKKAVQGFFDQRCVDYKETIDRLEKNKAECDGTSDSMINIDQTDIGEDIANMETLIQYVSGDKFLDTKVSCRPTLHYHASQYSYVPLLNVIRSKDGLAQINKLRYLLTFTHSLHIKTPEDAENLAKMIHTWLYNTIGTFHCEKPNYLWEADSVTMESSEIHQVPSIAEMNGAGIKIKSYKPEVLDFKDPYFDEYSNDEIEPGIKIELEEDNTQTVSIQEITIADLRYGYEDFKTGRIPHVVRNVCEQAFARAMITLSRLIPDEPSFQVAIDKGIIPLCLYVDFTWWKNNVLRNASYYLSGLFFLRYCDSLNETLDEVTAAYAIRSHPLIKEVYARENEAERMGLSFCCPNWNISLDSLALDTIQQAADKIHMNAAEYLCSGSLYQMNMTLYKVNEDSETIDANSPEEVMATDTTQYGKQGEDYICLNTFSEFADYVRQHFDDIHQEMRARPNKTNASRNNIVPAKLVQSPLPTVVAPVLEKPSKRPIILIQTNLRKSSIIPLVDLFNTVPNRAISIIDKIAFLLKTRVPAEFSHQHAYYVEDVLRHIFDNFWYHVPDDYWANFDMYDDTHGVNVMKKSNEPKYRTLEELNIPTLFQLQDGARLKVRSTDLNDPMVIDMEDTTGLYESNGDGVHISTTALLYIPELTISDIRLAKNNFFEGTQGTALLGYHIDHVVRLAALIPDEPSYRVAETSEIIDKSLMIDWNWWKINIVGKARGYLANEDDFPHYSMSKKVYRSFDPLRSAYHQFRHSLSSREILRKHKFDEVQMVKFFYPALRMFSDTASLETSSEEQSLRAKSIIRQRIQEYSEIVRRAEIQQIDQNQQQEFQQNIDDLLHIADSGIESTSPDTKEPIVINDLAWFIIKLPQIAESMYMEEEPMNATRFTFREDIKEGDMYSFAHIFSTAQQSREYRVPYGELQFFKKVLLTCFTKADSHLVEFFTFLIPLLFGDFHDTLPAKWIDGSLVRKVWSGQTSKSFLSRVATFLSPTKSFSSTEHRERIMQFICTIPSLYLLHKSGFMIQSSPSDTEDTELNNGIYISIQKAVVRIRAVSLLDIRYKYSHFPDRRHEENLQLDLADDGWDDWVDFTPCIIQAIGKDKYLTQGEIIESYYADSMVKLAVLIPNKQSFDIAVEADIIPDSLFINWEWWSENVVTAAKKYYLYGHKDYRLGTSTYEVLANLRKNYTKQTNPSFMEEWIVHILRNLRDSIFGLFIFLITILTLVQTVKDLGAF